MEKAKLKNWVAGRWFIESMDQWDRDYIDEEVRGYFEFNAKHGEFQFGCVLGQIDYRLGERDGKPAVEFSWDGDYEIDQAQGRGWLVLNDGELEGMFYMHMGKDSGIVLKREPEKKAAKATRKPR